LEIFWFNKAFLWGTAFFFGFISINLPLIIGGGEYQPLILLTLSILAYFNKSKKNITLIYAFHGILLAILISIVINLIVGDLNLIDLFKIMVGPLFLVTSLAFIKKIPFAAYKLLIIFHFIFFIIGIMSPELASIILGLFGFRSGLWYAYFSSEPSYFVINFSGILSMMFLKSGLDNYHIPKCWLLISIILLISSRSVTSIFFVIILLAVLFLDLKPLKRIFIFIPPLLFLNFLDSETSLQSFNRVALLAQEILNQPINNILFAANAVDPSGFWRLLTNFSGILTLINSPFGYGHLQISSHVDMLSETFPMLGDLIYSNEVFNLYSIGGSDNIFYTNAILPAYIVYGGFLLSIMIILIFTFAIIKLYKYYRVSNNKLILFAIFYLAVGFIWQTALSNPFWWITLGCALAWHDKKLEPVKLKY
jgi:hypothetical protein